MKKVIYLATAILLIISCSKDEVANYEGKQSDLTGVWKLKSVKYEDVDITDDCYKKSTISVKSDGSAIWKEYSEYDGDCSMSIDSYIFKANNVNFDIEDNSSSSRYYGKFYSKNDIEITKFFNDGDGLKATTVYRFKK